jgi:biopolymer transport protein TolR
MSSWHSQENDSISDINMTPFVDVLLVLLVIFMVTAPIVNQAIQIELPKDSYKDDKAQELDPLRVVINAENEIFVGKNKIGDLKGKDWVKSFQAKVDSWKQGNGPWFADVEADERVAYGVLIPIIARLKEMEVNLNLVIQPDSN